MPKGILFVAPRAEDPTRAEQEWMAAENEKALRALDWDLVKLEAGDAHRQALERAASDTRDGCVFVAHGRLGSTVRKVNDAIMGADGSPALDSENADLFAGAWIHALVCHGGTELAAQVVHRGARCFAGYRGPLLVEWNISEIPVQIREHLSALIASTTTLLARGICEQNTLRKHAQMHADEILSWCMEQPADSPLAGLEYTVQQLAQVVLIARRVWPAFPAIVDSPLTRAWGRRVMGCNSHRDLPVVRLDL